MDIKRVDFDDPQLISLLELHLQDMHSTSPEGTNYALGLDALKHPKIDFLGIWEADHLAGFGALKEMNSNQAEIKSMRTHPSFLRRGVGATLLSHLIQLACQRGFSRLSLETGTTVEYEPALALYKKHRFINGDIFGDYRPSPYNQFLHLDL